MARFASDAEYYRHHRKCFNLAQELGCTPQVAEIELKKREAQADWEACEKRMRAAQEQLPAIAKVASPDPEAADDKPWLMRDLDK